jgi:hypothetical protein
MKKIGMVVLQNCIVDEQTLFACALLLQNEAQFPSDLTALAGIILGNPSPPASEGHATGGLDSTAGC